MLTQSKQQGRRYSFRTHLVLSQANGIKDFMSHENKSAKMLTWFHYVANNSIEDNEVESVFRSDVLENKVSVLNWNQRAPAKETRSIQTVLLAPFCLYCPWQ